MTKYEMLARRALEAIKGIAASDECSCDFERYLSKHFEIWIKKFANTPEKFVDELEQFALESLPF